MACPVVGNGVCIAASDSGAAWSSCAQGISVSPSQETTVKVIRRRENRFYWRGFCLSVRVVTLHNQPIVLTCFSGGLENRSKVINSS